MFKPSVTKSSAVRAASALASVAVLVALGGCGREADKASRNLADDSASAPVRAERVSTGGRDDRSYSSRDRATNGEAQDRPGQDRRPGDDRVVWATSQRGSAGENARRQFARNGADFSAASMDDYVAQARAFVADPPKGVLHAERANGDRLYYDPKANVFVAADRRGLPRTMFKPRDGKAYWAEQQQRIADGGDDRNPGRAAGRSRSGDDARDDRRDDARG